MNTFQDMGLPEALCHTLAHMTFTTPTPIQAQAIPLALQGQDILGTAQTGTGKTAAFGIPLAAMLINQPTRNALIMTPTRELATQVMAELQAILGKSGKMKTALLIGGDSMPKQLQQLRQHPRLIVGTPGRINDHLKRQSNMLAHTDFLVLDETDRMLDMGFTVQINEVMKYMPQTRQTLLFSATLSKNIERMADKYLTNPARVAVSAMHKPATNIKQETVKLQDADKYNQLLDALNQREGSVVIFVKTKHGADRMATKLGKDGFSSDAIHGDLRQNKRDRVMAAYRKSAFRVLVATDVAARGLDVPHIRHVINYDMPQAAEDYIHRIGRTARAGATGEALNFVSPADSAKWRAIQHLLDPEAAPARPAVAAGTKTSGRRKPATGNTGKRPAKPFGAPRKPHLSSAARQRRPGNNARA